MRKLFFFALICFIFTIIDVRSQTPISFDFSLKNFVDVIFLVDESSTFVKYQEHVVLKETINLVTERLKSPDWIPQFAVGFYGLANQIQWPVKQLTNNLTTIRRNLSLYGLGSQKTNPANLLDALKEVKQMCKDDCRPVAARYTVIITHSIDSSWEMPIRELEFDLFMNVIIVEIGRINTFLLETLVTSPSKTNALRSDDFINLVSIPDNLAEAMERSPRPLNYNSLFRIGDFDMAEYMNFRLEIADVSASSDVLVSFYLKCFDCRVYASLEESKPTYSNSNQLFSQHIVPTVAYGSVYYFGVPRNTRRLFISVRSGYRAVDLEGTVNLIALPHPLSSP